MQIKMFTSVRNVLYVFSIAVEPLYPQVCQKVSVLKPVSELQGLSPTDLNRALNSVACSLGYRRDKPISLFHLIMEVLSLYHAFIHSILLTSSDTHMFLQARHFMQCVWNCVQFWVCCGVSLSALQTLGVLLMLPPIFSTGKSFNVSHWFEFHDSWLLLLQCSPLLL